MIRFFRKIRLWLVEHSKFQKYLLYAVGEILLVVIGILIALQINNANENRKLRLQEITILENLQQDMYLDTFDIRFNLNYHARFLKGEKDLLRFLLSSKKESESPIDYDAALGTPLIVVMHQSTFDNLQNNEIGILSNNELRKNIARYHDFFKTAMDKIENEYPTYQTYETKLPYFLKYFKLKSEVNNMFIDNPDEQDYYNPDFEKAPITISDVIGARNDEAFKIVLSESMFFRQVKIDYYKDLLNRITSLTDEIDAELIRLRSI